MVDYLLKLDPLHTKIIAPRLVEIGPVVKWRRRFSNVFNVFSLFLNYLPLEKGMALHLNRFESPYPRMLCAKFG